MNRTPSTFPTPFGAGKRLYPDACPIKQVNVFVTPGGDLEIDASGAGLAPGEWPQVVVVVDENGIPMTERFWRQRNIHSRGAGGRFLAVEYGNALGKLLTIANT